MITFNGRAIFQKKEAAGGHYARFGDEHREASGQPDAGWLTEADTANVRTETYWRMRATLAISRVDSELHRCDLEAGPDLRKIGQTGPNFRKGVRPRRFCPEVILPDSAELTELEATRLGNAHPICHQSALYCVPHSHAGGLPDRRAFFRL